MVFTEPYVGCANRCEVRKLVSWWCFLLQHLLSRRFRSILHCIHQSGAPSTVLGFSSLVVSYRDPLLGDVLMRVGLLPNTSRRGTMRSYTTATASLLIAKFW